MPSFQLRFNQLIKAKLNSNYFTYCFINVSPPYPWTPVKTAKRAFGLCVCCTCLLYRAGLPTNFVSLLRKSQTDTCLSAFPQRSRFQSLGQGYDDTVVSTKRPPIMTRPGVRATQSMFNVTKPDEHSRMSFPGPRELYRFSIDSSLPQTIRWPTDIDIAIPGPGGETGYCHLLCSVLSRRLCCRGPSCPSCSRGVCLLALFPLCFSYNSLSWTMT